MCWKQEAGPYATIMKRKTGSRDYVDTGDSALSLKEVAQRHTYIEASIGRTLL